MDTVLQDLRYAARQLARNRTATAVTIVALALGIAANTSMFTVLSAVLFRPVPTADPARIAWITSAVGRGGRPQNMSYPDFVDVRARSHAFAGMFGYTHVWLSLGGDAPERVRGEVVSGDYFDVLGIAAQRGRVLHAADDAAPGASAVAVLSDGAWRRHFGASPSIIDSTITINGRPFTVVGVAPPGFAGVEINDDAPLAVWIPMAMVAIADPELIHGLSNRNSAGWLRTMGRLSPSATLQSASAELAVLAPQLRRQHADTTEGFTLRALAAEGGVDPSNRAEALPVLSLLMVVPLLVLAVACANAANVLLARGLSRAREFAMRRALGATRARLVAQLLTESLLLSLVAGVAGVVLSFWLTGIIAHVGAIPDGFVDAMTPNRQVLTWTLALVMATGVLFGLAPALAATRASLAPALKDDGALSGGGQGRHRLRDAFLVGQVAVSLVLLVTAGLFVQSLSKALRVDPGFTARTGVLASFDPDRLGYPAERRAALERALLDRVRAIPGVRAAALTTNVPFGGHFAGTELRADSADPNSPGIDAFVSWVSPDYFRTLGIPLVRGRAFSAHDDATGAPVIIVNETLARTFWPGQDPVGKQLPYHGHRAEVVGVARDGKYANLTERQRSYLYLPESQRTESAQMTLVANTSGGVEGITAAIRATTRALDPDLPLYDVTTLSQLVRGAADIQQAIAASLAVFGSLALTLAALGVYGVTAHGVIVRTREIGIRMSLGAPAGEVLALFVREGLVRALVGVAIGVAVSVALSRVLAGFLFGLQATDTVTFLAAAAALAGMTAVASYIPARRAAMVDPVAALRAE